MQQTEPDSLVSVHHCPGSTEYPDEFRNDLVLHQPLPQSGEQIPQVHGPRTEESPVQMGGWQWNEVNCYLSRNVGFSGQEDSDSLCPPLTSCSHTLDFTRKEKHFFFPLSQIHIHCPEALDLSEIFGKQL